MADGQAATTTTPTTAETTTLSAVQCAQAMTNCMQPIHNYSASLQDGSFVPYMTTEQFSQFCEWESVRITVIQKLINFTGAFKLQNSNYSLHQKHYSMKQWALWTDEQFFLAPQAVTSRCQKHVQRASPDIFLALVLWPRLFMKQSVLTNVQRLGLGKPSGWPVEFQLWKTCKKQVLMIRPGNPCQQKEIQHFSSKCLIFEPTGKGCTCCESGESACRCFAVLACQLWEWMCLFSSKFDEVNLCFVPLKCHDILHNTMQGIDDAMYFMCKEQPDRKWESIVKFWSSGISHMTWVVRIVSNPVNCEWLSLV